HNAARRRRRARSEGRRHPGRLILRGRGRVMAEAEDYYGTLKPTPAVQRSASADPRPVEVRSPAAARPAARAPRPAVPAQAAVSDIVPDPPPTAPPPPVAARRHT